MPDTSQRFGQHTERISGKGFSLGALANYGKGRIAVFGEAPMFTGQLKGAGKIPFGLKFSRCKTEPSSSSQPHSLVKEV